MFHRTWRTAAVSFLLLGVLAPSAWANAGVFGGTGQSIRLESTDKIQLRTENVTITMGRGMFPFDGGVPGMDAVLYDCRFELVNLTDQEVGVQVGFPLAGGGLGAARDPEDAREMLFRQGFIARDDDTTYHVRWAAADAERKFRGLYLWDMRFAAGQTRHLRVRYRLPLTMGAGTTARKRSDAAAPDGLHPLLDPTALIEAMTYVTETGASWAGEIEVATFTVHTAAFERYLRGRGWVEPSGGDTGGELVPPRVLMWRKVDPAGHRPHTAPRSLDPTGIQWRFAPFEPGPQLSIVWFLTRLPATPEALDDHILNCHGPDPSRRDLEILRGLLRAFHGIVPKNERALRFAEGQVWYEPKPDAAASLSAEARALLEAVDRRIGAARYPVLDTDGEPVEYAFAHEDKPLEYWVRRLAAEGAEERLGAAARAIATMGSPILETVYGWLDTDDVELLRGAVLAVAGLAEEVRTPDAVRVRLAEILRGADETTGRYAARALVAFGESSRPWLGPVMKDASTPARRRVLDVSGWPHAAGADALAVVLADEDAGVREAALRALGTVGYRIAGFGKEAFSHVLARLGDEAVGVRKAAIAYLRASVWILKDAQKAELVEGLVALIEREPASRVDAVDALHWMAAEAGKALPLLRRLRGAADGELAAALDRAIGEIESKAPAVDK